MKNKLIAICCIIVAFSILSCTKSMSKEAESTVKKALNNLKSGNVNGFISAIIPRQQKKYRKFITSAPYFTTLKDFDMMDLSKEVDDNNAIAWVYMKYPENTRTSFRFFLDKVKGKWYINFKESYEAEKRMNGIHAFSAIEYK